MNIVLPSLGDIDEVEVTEICVAVGDLVSAEDSIIVIESDKASMEVPAGHQGTVTELHVSVGDLLNEGAVIGTLTESAAVTTTESTAQSAPQDDQGGLVEPEREQSSSDTVAPMPLGNRLCRYSCRIWAILTRYEVIEVAAQPGTSVNPGDLLVVLESDKGVHGNPH